MIQSGSFRWEPQPGPQTAALTRQEKEILYGGARGGGKSEAAIIWVALPALMQDSKGRPLHPYYRALVLRRHADDLKNWFDRAEEKYVKMGAKRIGSAASGGYFLFPGGAKIHTGHLRDSQAYTKYIGHEYQRMVIEEATLIPQEEMYERLLGSCRSKYPDLPPQVFLTTNPGGPGHGWVRKRFIYAEDGRTKRIPGHPFQGKDGNWRIWIPATVDDNPILKDADPGYVAFLDSLPPALRRAWRDGDWDAFLGQYFSEFRPYGPVGEEERQNYPNANHVIPPTKLEPWWHRWISGDWGFNHPASIHWFAQASNGQVHVYRELHVRGVGSKELGVMIARESEQDLRGLPEPYMTLSFGKDIFRKVDDGPTQAEQIASGIDEFLGKGSAVLLDPSDPPRELRYSDSKPRIIIRIAADARVAGWMNVRDFLRFKRIFPDEDKVLPKLQIWDTCPHLIEQLQTMVFDDEGPNPEDALKIDAIDGVGGDDAADSLRYGLMAWKLRHNVEPLSVYLMEKMNALSRRYNGNVDPTIAYMVAQHIESQYGKQHHQIKPVSFRRLSSRKGAANVCQ